MIAGHYYDGTSARGVRVELAIHGGVAAIRGDDVRRSIPLEKLQVSEPLDHAPRILRLPDGAVIESDDPALEGLLRDNGYHESAVVKWQRRWPVALLSLAALIAVLLAAYQWGLPRAADAAAHYLPAVMERHIGEEAWNSIDGVYFQPSQLGKAQQEHLRQAFAQLSGPADRQVTYRIEFRSSVAGANAFALPNGVIVVTDDLVRLAGDERALLGVFAHELGHVERRHAMRRLLQALGVGALVNLAVGDISGVLAMVPTILLDRNYSREFEREADGYAIDMMRANHVPLAPLASLFEKMAEAGGGDNEEGGGTDYLSSHPGDAERIARFREADSQ